MKKFFMYELKKHRFAMWIITACITLLYFATVSTSDYSERMYAQSSVAMPLTFLAILCMIVPIWIFSFKMKAKQVDLYYSMPIKRKQIYFVKAIVGLILVLVPYTICYWFGFLPLLYKANSFSLIYFLPLYFASLPCAVILFGFCAFAFTRANHIVDGYFFIGMYTGILPILSTVFYYKILANSANSVTFLQGTFWFPQSPLVFLGSCFEELISGNGLGSSIMEVFVNNSEHVFLIFFIPTLLGAAAWAGLFLTIKKEKPENAEHISDSIFGYTFLNPAYLFAFSFLAGLTMGFLSGITVIYLIMIFISALVSYIIFRRGFKLQGKDAAMILGSIFLGCLFGMI